MKSITRIFVVLLAILMLVPVLSAVVGAAKEEAEKKKLEAFFGIGETTITTGVKVGPQGIEYYRTMTRTEAYVSLKIEEQGAKKNKETLKTIQESLEKAEEGVAGLKDWIKKIKETGEMDDVAISECVDIAVDALLSIGKMLSMLPPPVGPIAGIVTAAVDILYTIGKGIMGGEEATPEMAQLEDRLTMQLDEIKNQLSGIEDQINALSAQITEEANRIISEVTSAIDNLEARTILREFMLSSGKGDFSYNELKNYLYGTGSRSTAYYKLYTDALAKGKNEEAQKYYDLLYKSVVESRNSFMDYVLGNGASKSVVQCYYDILVRRADLVPEGSTAEAEAILFAYDIYQTELEAALVISGYQTSRYFEMCINDESEYWYGSEDDDFINETIIKERDLESLERLDKMQLQFAKDIAYILKMFNSYTVKEANGEIYTIVNNDSATFGNVLEGQTIYLTPVSDAILNDFDLKSEDFAYISAVTTLYSGVNNAFNVTGGNENINVALIYKGTALGEIDFEAYTKDSQKAAFNGGSGTVGDPYLISNKAQFEAISNDLTKHYKLICDIDFKSKTVTPLGRRINSNNAIVYDPLTGSLDGNGYKVKNLTVNGTDYAGLFGKIGQGGIVANLELYNVKVNANLGNAKESNTCYYAGVIAGTNEGTIKNCKINSDGKTDEIDGFNVPVYGLTLKATNTTHNRNIFVNAGGIVGANYNKISACSVENTKVIVNSSHNFGGDAVETNIHNAYVGGICGENYGYIGFSEVKSSVSLYTHVKMIYNPDSDVYPHASALTGGIVGQDSTEDFTEYIAMVKSEAVIIKNKVELDCESLYGEHKKNCKDEDDQYIPLASKNDIDEIISDEDLTEKITPSKNNYTITHSYKDESGSLYEAGDKKFKREDLKILVNGEEKAYKIIGLYGFDTDNESFIKTNDVDVTMLIQVELDKDTKVFEYKIKIKVKPSVIKEKELFANLIVEKEDYNLEELIDKKDLVITTNDGRNLSYTLSKENIKSVKNISKGSYARGKRTYEVMYDLNEAGIELALEINVYIACEHENGYELNKEETIEPSCEKIGTNIYNCVDCGSEYKDFVAKLAHTPVFEPGYEPYEATCQSTGFTGKLICLNCKALIDEGETIPKKPHIYEQISETEHECYQGGVAHTEHHHYTVKESVQWINNKWGIVYTYTCFGCNYSYTETDTNTVLDENKALPTVMVSDGYALNIGDEVVVYVQLLNNPGINGACFGIRYTEGLELVGLYDGELFDGSLLSYRAEVNNGYNFVWVGGSSDGDEITSVDTVNGSGNLLKLKFKVTADIEAGKERKVSVVYGMGKTPSGKDVNGGFVTSSNENQCFVTEDGIIKIVDRLPGDVNNDGKVDIKDALEIAKFLTVENKDELDERYANVDLSFDKKNPNASNIGANDIIVLLKSIIGGYGTNLKPYSFDITLVTFDDKAPETTIQASMYNEKGEIVNTYSQIVSELERRGYKFLGWSYSMANGELINTSDFIIYNNGQGKQTLYAQWEINSVSFIPSADTTEGNMEAVYYSEDEKIEIINNFLKYYNVLFVFDINDFSKNNIPSKLEYDVVKWEYKVNGELLREFDSLADVVLAIKSEHFGSICLSPVFETKGKLSFPEWENSKTGYSLVDWSGKNGSYDVSVGDNVDEIPTTLSQTAYNGKNYYVLSPIWEANTYKVSFNANGGVFTSGETVKNENRIFDSTYGALPSDPNRLGYTFKGWSTIKDDESGKIDSKTIVSIGNNHTLYALWSANEYYVTFNANGGTVSQQGKTVQFDYTYGRLPVPTRKGYNFEGWFTESGEKITESSVVTKSTSHTLKARWVLKMITVKLDANGGSASKDSIFVGYGYSGDVYFGLLPIPTRANYVFLGWYSSASGGSKITENTVMTSEEDITLYARWENESYLFSEIRTSETVVKITDSDSYVQVVNFKELTKEKLKAIKDAGYNKVTLTIELDAFEVNDGWVDINLYKYLHDTNVELISLTNKFSFEKSCGCYNDDAIYQNYTLVADWPSTHGHIHKFVFNFNVSELFDEDGLLCIVFGASGKDDDTWQLGSLAAYVKFSK